MNWKANDAYWGKNVTHSQKHPAKNFLIKSVITAWKRALAKKKKLRTLGKRTRSVESEDEMEEDGKGINPLKNKRFNCYPFPLSVIMH